jgi:hypothetical protein
MELASMLAGEPFSDRPRCASPIVGAILRACNDGMLDDHRQVLVGYAARVVGTGGDRALERARLDRCARALREAHGRLPRRRRLLSPRPPATLAHDGRRIDSLGAEIVRRLRRSAGGSYAPVLALLDEIVALGRPAEVGVRLAEEELLAASPA